PRGHRHVSSSPAWAPPHARVGAPSPQMQPLASSALPDPLGSVLSAACLMLLTEALRTGAAPGHSGSGGLGFALLAGLAAGLACLTRYASVVLFPVGAVVLLARGGRWRGRLGAVAAFLAAGLVPLGAWLARNV